MKHSFNQRKQRSLNKIIFKIQWNFLICCDFLLYADLCSKWLEENSQNLTIFKIERRRYLSDWNFKKDYRISLWSGNVALFLMAGRAWNCKIVFIFLNARIIFARGTSHLLFSAWSNNLQTHDNKIIFKGRDRLDNVVKLRLRNCRKFCLEFIWY